MKMTEAMIVWNKRGGILVCKWPAETREHKAYKYSTGACYMDRHEMPEIEQERYMLMDFAHAIRNGVDPRLAMREFEKIDEFREMFKLAENCLE